MDQQGLRNHLTSGMSVNHSFDISYEEFQRQQQDFQSSMAYTGSEAVNMSTTNVMLDPYHYTGSYDQPYASSLPGSYGAGYEFGAEGSGFAEEM